MSITSTARCYMQRMRGIIERDFEDSWPNLKNGDKLLQLGLKKLQTQGAIFDAVMKPLDAWKGACSMCSLRKQIVESEKEIDIAVGIIESIKVQPLEADHSPRCLTKHPLQRFASSTLAGRHRQAIALSAQPSGITNGITYRKCFELSTRRWRFSTRPIGNSTIPLYFVLSIVFLSSFI